MKTAIVGFGFVGKALNSGIINSEILKIDPKLNTKISDLKSYNPDIVFICVPTPMGSNGSQDVTILKEVFKEIKRLEIDSKLVIKSTVTPSNINALKEHIDAFTYSPEFLRESNAESDFINSPIIIFGGPKSDHKFLSDYFRNNTKCVCNEYILTDSITASLIKYTINTFLATKVIFFNELFHLFNSSGASDTWENFIKAIAKDTRMGHSHMLVPGPDKRFGYGGACFPKDASAFVDYSLNQKNDLNLLKTAININNEIRSAYNKNTIREDEQNITFNKVIKE